MPIEEIYYCSGPDNPDITEKTENTLRPEQRTGIFENTCPRYDRTMSEKGVEGWLTVSHGKETHVFCSWDCLLRYAAHIPEEIPLEEDAFSEKERDEEDDELAK